jgi:hypothetical protein
MGNVVKYICLCLLLAAGSVKASASAPVMQWANVRGEDILTGKEVVARAEPRRDLVVVFLSAVCPCSDSHLQELKALVAEYPEFHFIGVHSNADEPVAMAKSYFSKVDLPFPVIQDGDDRLANLFKAVKTPHAFVVDVQQGMLYRGGVSSSHDFKSADRKYLREALVDIHAGHAVRTPEARTLGCAISRN